MIRIAAVGDVHYDRHSRAGMATYFRALEGKADLLLVAGDLTQSGEVDEARAFAADLAYSPIPVVIVLGNHDYHLGHEREMAEMLRNNSVTVLEGQSAIFRVRDFDVGVVGLKGFGGGFFGACVTDFGEIEVKTFARKAKEQAETLRRELASLDTNYKFVLLHFAPIEGTLLGESREIFPFLGSYLLAEAIDAEGADGVFHGHAHRGAERGQTPGGVPVRNVAQPVIRHAYNIYHFEAPRSVRLEYTPARAHPHPPLP